MSALYGSLGDFPVTKQRTVDKPFQDVQPSTGTDILNEAATDAINQAQADWDNANAWDARNIYNSRPQPPNYMNAPILKPDQRRAAQNLLDLKTAWGAAQQAIDSANDPDFQKNTGLDPKAFQALQRQIQSEAGKQANTLREAMTAAGMNMDGYGADISLDDAQKYLLSNDLRARQEAIQKYTQTADDYYENRYRALVKQGYRPSQARRWAGEDARQFQAEKVAYLSDALQGYGFDGGYLNDFGTQIVGMLGNADNELANYYAKMYNSPAKAQDRANSLEDKLLDQGFEREKLGLRFDYNERGADSALERTIKQLKVANALDTQRQIDVYDAKAKTDEGYKIAGEVRAQEREARRLAEIDAWIDSVFDGDDAKVAKAAARNIKLPQKKGETMSDDSLKNLKTLHEMCGKRAQALRDLLAKGDQYNPDPKIVKQYNEVVQQMAAIEETFGDVLYGVQTDNGVEGIGVFSETDDEANIDKIAEILAYKPDGTEAEQFKAVRNFVPKDRTDHYVRQLIAKARARLKR